MQNSKKHQQGSSKVLRLIFLALIAFGVFVGIQYVPIYLEHNTINSVMDSVERRHQDTKIKTELEAKRAISDVLAINDQNDLNEKFVVQARGGMVTISADSDYELNLLYKKSPITYDRVITLQ